MRAAGLFASASAVLVVAAMVGGMVVIGPPWEARDRRLDERRVRDLRAIAAAVERHADEAGRLPEMLDALQRPTQRFPVPVGDPVSGDAYDYAATGPASYRLCATFDAASEPDAAARGLWEHPPGYHCFALDLPPEPRDDP